MMTVALAADLVRWFQLLCVEGAWRDARPKALRWAIFHAPGRFVPAHAGTSCASSTAGRPPMC